MTKEQASAKITEPEFREYLLQTHGPVPYKYGDSKNREKDDTKGLFIHHVGENEIASLSSPYIRQITDPKYQQPDMLVYCDYLEHLFIHILIAESYVGEKDFGIDGPFQFIVPPLKAYFYKGLKNERINSLYYSRIEGQEEIFDILMDRFNKVAKDINVLFEHNKNAFYEMSNYLDTKNKALLVLGTSGGKTSTALEWVYRNNCRALALGPTDSIRQDWESNDICDAYTYQGFSNNKFYQTVDYSKYGIIILDESHHVGYDEETENGAKTWSEPIKWIIDNNKCKVLGLTATNERTDGIDIAKTFFKDCTVKGLTVEEMIEQGILYPFSYVSAIYDYHEIMQEFKALRNDADETTKKLLGQLDLTINNTKTVNSILNEYVEKQGNKNIKGIVFVSANSKKTEQNTIDEARNILINSFPHMKNKIRVLYSDDDYMSREGNTCSENKKWFEDNSEGFIITINQAGEGWHPKGINTVIMFRKTSSYVVFTQQLGRIMTLKRKGSIDPHAIVFDLVNNINNISFRGKVTEKKHRERTHIEKIIRALESKKSSQVIIADETLDFVSKYRELKEYIKDDWEEWELEILKKYYNIEYGNQCVKRIDEEWLKRYPNSLKPGEHHRTYEAIKRAARWYNIALKSNAPKWTADEDEIIRNHLYQCSKEEIERLLPHRKYENIMQRASKLKIYKPTNAWTEEEKRILKENRDKLTDEELTKLLPNRTARQIKDYAVRHKIQAKNNVRLELLRSNIIKLAKEGKTNKEIQKILNTNKETIRVTCKKANIILTKEKDKNSYQTYNQKMVICEETGEIFKSGAEAIRKYGKCVSMNLCGKTKSAYDKHFKYIEDGE